MRTGENENARARRALPVAPKLAKNRTAGDGEASALASKRASDSDPGCPGSSYQTMIYDVVCLYTEGTLGLLRIRYLADIVVDD